jgi:hypothetical protein
VDARDVPLSLVASGANRHDSFLLRATLAGVVYPLPEPESCMQALCADAAYVGLPALEASRIHNHEPNMKTRRREKDEKRDDPSKRARRWVVERTHFWFNRFVSVTFWPS